MIDFVLTNHNEISGMTINTSKTLADIILQDKKYKKVVYVESFKRNSDLTKNRILKKNVFSKTCVKNKC